MKSAIFQTARRAFHLSGGTGFVRFGYRHGARILMYHRFPEPHRFEEQCRHLKQFYRPISMTELGSTLQEGKKLSPNSVVITVDDGYRDFLTNAFPVLSAYSIPAIVFLATDMLDHRTCLWVDWVRVLFRSSPLKQVTLELPGREPAAYRTHEASSTVNQALKQAPNADRLAFLTRLPDLLQVASKLAIPESVRPLDWDEVRKMAKAGIEFGAHTMSHPILSRLASKDEIRGELAGSKSRIEQELQRPCRHFCYPNGTFGDFNQATIETLRECGFQTSVVGEPGLNFAGADLYQLRRFAMEPAYAGLKFAQKVAGLNW